MTQVGPGAYAERLGVTLQALRDMAVKHGLPWQPGGKLVPVEAMDAAWAKLYRQGRVKTPAPEQEDDDQDTDDLEAAKLRRAIAQADIDEMKAAKLRGELVAVLDVEATWSRMAIAINETFDALPARLANVLPGDRRANQILIRDELRAARAALSERVAVEIAEVEAEAAARVEPEPEPEPTKTPAKKRGRPPRAA